MNLSREQPRLSKEQIMEIACEIFETICIGMNPRHWTIEYIVNTLTAKFGQQPGAKEESFPKHGDPIFYITEDGRVKETQFAEDDNFCKRLIEIGNIYRTKEEAEARVQLMKHIQKFEKPNRISTSFWISTSFYSFDDIEGWEVIEYEGCRWGFNARWQSGLFIPYGCTEEDRAERIELLKKCFS